MDSKIKKYTIFFSICTLALLVYALTHYVSTKKNTSTGAQYYKESVKINGVERHYFIFIPASIQNNKKNPAVIAYHGYESDPGGLRWLTKVDPWAEEYKYIMIYPLAINKSWNAGRGFGNQNTHTDDLSFAAALPDVISSRHAIDPKRIYTMGFSNGAQMSALMLCKLSHKIAAAAMVAHTLNIDNCQPKHTTPVAIIHGKKDTLAPFTGGGKHNVRSHRQTVDFFRKYNQTAGKPKAIITKKTVRCYVDYGHKTEVANCIPNDAGHSWPGGVEFKTELFGLTNKELIANKFIFNFFNSYKGIAPIKKKPKKKLATKEKLHTSKKLFGHL